MTRFLKTSLILIVFLSMALMGGGPQALADQSKVVLVGGGQAYKPLDDFVLESESPTIAGDSWYVDSGKTASGDGKSWDYAVITLNEAIDLCTADNGDVIHVAPGHAESIIAATTVVPDIDGITVIGYGEGAQRPTFSWLTGTAASFPVSGSDFVLKNMIFDGSSDVVTVAMFTVTGAGFQLIGCEIVTGDATEQAALVITADADADRMKVIGNHFTGSTDTGSTAAISFSAAATDIEIAYNVFKGDYSSAAIASASAILEVNIHHNYIYNFQDDDHAIEISSNTATGVIAYNHVVTDAYATAIDSGGLDVIETYWSNDEADDVMAVQVWTNEDGAVTWSATQLVVMETQANDALVDEDLDHLAAVTAGTAAYPTDVLDDAIIGHIMATNYVTSYVRTTDSLEAIGTQVSDAQIQANVTAMIEADNLDELAVGAVAASLSTSVVNTSILGYLMADSDMATYDRTTDSLEAIGTNLAAGTGAIVALESFELDELLDDAVTTNLQTAVDDASVMGYLMAAANISTYDRTTDSLEAIGTDVVAIEVDTTAIETDTQDLQQMAERSLTYAAAVLPATTATAIFTVGTGPVEILALAGFVTVGMDPAANNLKIIFNPTTGTDTDLCANLDVTGDVAGTMYTLSTSLATALQSAALGVDEGMGAFSIIVPVGTIDLNTSSTQTTGRVEWHIRYRPLALGADITLS